MPGRDLDIVVLGASSTAGRRVAAYIDDRSKETEVRWAAAGRDAARVEKMLAEEGAEAPEVLVADVDDAASLESLAARAKVVLNLVGPYTSWGRPVIDACVSGGAHYVDLSGEIPFVRRMISEFDEPARAAGVKVVQVCGYESLPPDLAVQLAVERAAAAGDGLEEADATVTADRIPMPPRPSDFVSGGTLQSVAAAAGDDDAAVLSDPACLVDEPALAGAVRSRSPIELAPRRNARGQIVAPMAPAAFINPPVLHRSFALRAAEGWQDTPIRFREGLAVPGPAAAMPLQYAVAGAIALPQLGLTRLAAASPAARRRVAAGLERMLPGAGFGPATSRLDDWRWRLDLVARSTSGAEIEVEVVGEGNPGYLTTARMMGEAGLLLAEEGASPDRAGCLTPALAIGTERIDRFDRAGLRFSVR